jgi:hypothetical protein
MSDVSLAQALQAHREAAMIGQAETILHWPERQERLAQAEIHVRQALLEEQNGRISSAVKVKVFSLLHFAMPDVATYTEEPALLPELEQGTDWEAAYHEQLQQRSCPECGDGLCPVDDDPRLQR